MNQTHTHLTGYKSWHTSGATIRSPHTMQSEVCLIVYLYIVIMWTLRGWPHAHVTHHRAGT